MRVKRSSSKGQGREQGVALITAILITALATVAAVGMLNRQYMDVRRAENMLHSDQALIYALGVETAAAEYLNADQDKKIDLRDEFMDFELALAGGTVVEGGAVNGRIIQLSGAFPLNDLVDQNGQRQGQGRQGQPQGQSQGLIDYTKALGEYFALISTDKPDLFSASQENLVLDWIDTDSDTDPGGAEDSQYLNLDKPYRTRNNFLASITELRLMMTDFGFNKASVDLLLKGDEKGNPYVNALPVNDAAININVADKALLKAVLQSTLRGIDDATIDKIDQTRVSGSPSTVPGHPSTPGSGFKEVNEMLTIVDVALTDPADKKAFADLRPALIKTFSVNTEYFKVESEAVIGSTTVRLNSLLKRDNSANRVVTLWRSIGTE